MGAPSARRLRKRIRAAFVESGLGDRDIELAEFQRYRKQLTLRLHLVAKRRRWRQWRTDELEKLLTAVEARIRQLRSDQEAEQERARIRRKEHENRSTGAAEEAERRIY